MAPVSPAADQATNLLQKLSLDSQAKVHDVPEVNKKDSSTQHGAADSKEAVSMPFDCSTTPFRQDFVDQNLFYVSNGYASPGYYYGSYDDSYNGWGGYSRYLNSGGADVPPQGVYAGDMYHDAFGYAQYGAYPPSSPSPTVGHDGQLYGPQQYQYPGAYYQPPSSGSTYSHTLPPTTQDSTSITSSKPQLSADTGISNSNGNTNVNANENPGSVPLQPALQTSSLTLNGAPGMGVLPGGHYFQGYQDPRFGFDGMRSPTPGFDGLSFSACADGPQKLATTSTASTNVSHPSNFASSRGQKMHPQPPVVGLHSPRPASAMGATGSGFMNRLYPNNHYYGQYGNPIRTGIDFGPNLYGSRMTGRGWPVMEGKYKPRGRGNMLYGFGNDHMEGLNELNKGPRSGRIKNNQKILGPDITVAVKEHNLPTNGNNVDSNIVPEKEQFNQADFPVIYSDAKFFVIKSYSEDDVHKSVKYGVWASTPNGNKKLDAAFQEVKEKAGGCPVFLFFSVNTSGQFVGVAEMMGPVDFDKTLEYWQQDKWNGCFPIKWHIVKDVPNSLLKHIILENNENKPVTNSRDTQEVKLEQGLEMLKLFKDHACKTSILDDFGFYETRQKVMQEKKVKQQFQKQVWDGKAAAATLVAQEKPTAEFVKLQLQNHVESAPIMNEETGNQKLSDNDVAANPVTEAPKGSTP